MAVDTQRIRAAAHGALLGTLVGDALGAPFEGTLPTAREKAVDRLERALASAPRTYTDDTQMACALAWHLLEHPEVEPVALAAAFRDAFEPWRGYGGGMQRVHDAWERGVPVEEAARAAFPDGSFGNGGAMRVAPVGIRWAHDPERLAAAAARSAEPTHVHPVGRDGAVVQAHAVGRAAAAGRFDRDDLAGLAESAATEALAAGLREAAEFTWPDELGDPSHAIADRLGNEILAHRSVPTACWIAATSESPREALVSALAVGGDTDSIGAMALAIRAAADGDAAIDDDLVQACEEPERVRDVAERLLAAL